MSTPNPNRKLTPEDAAALNRKSAAMRQADRRSRQRAIAEEEARIVAEREAEAAALEAARVERLADLERRLADAQETLRATQERLDDAVTLLAIHHDVEGYARGGATPTESHMAARANTAFLERFKGVTARYWTCTRSEAIARARHLFDSVDDRIPTLPRADGPMTVRPDVTSPDTPVTPTVRIADRPERIADRSHETVEISVEEQAWIDRQDPSPYDEYEARVAHIEAIAEGAIVEHDEDDGERF